MQASSEPGGDLQTLCWRDLASAVDRVAELLQQQFHQSPETPRRLGHASDNTLADVLIALASLKLQAIEVPLDARLPADEIASRWQRVGGLWITPTLRDAITQQALTPSPHLQASQSCAGSDPVNERAQALAPLQDLHAIGAGLILWTSGTTRRPQGVVLSQQNLVGNAAAKLLAVPQSPTDVRLTVLPLAHAYARTCDLGTWLLSGCTLVITLGWDGLQQFAPTVRPTLINTVPSLAHRMLDADATDLGLDRLRLLGCGGAAISADAFARWRQRGVTVIQGYGLTEAGPVICSATPDQPAAGLVGPLVDGWEHRLSDGELLVRGPHTMLGYWDDPQATKQKIDAEGWLHTGDRAEWDPITGQWRILGRMDEVIVLPNGYKLFHSLIEREIQQIAQVQHAMLMHRDGQLQLWVDVAANADPNQWQPAVQRVLDRQPHCRRCQVQQFTPPLSTAAGELTAKGTIRRRRITKNRFGDQAGS